MKVTQEKLPASQIGLEIEISAETTKKAYESTIQKFMRQANIPGFRKGKVPRQVIVQRFGAMGIKATSLEDLVDQSVKDAIKQEKIDALGNFQLKSDFEELITNYEPGNPLVFKAAVDVSPEVTLTKHQGLTVQVEEVKLDNSRIEESIDNYRKRLATLVPIEDRAAQMGDVVVVDYHGRFTPAGGEEQDVPGGQAEDFTLDLEEGGFIPGFIEGIVGMKVDEIKDITATFPEDYQADELAGQVATFNMTLKELKGRELPEANDDFAKELTNGDVTTIAQLRENIEKNFQREIDDRNGQNKETAILNELVKYIEVEIPETLLDRELNYMLNQTALQFQQQGLDIRQIFTQDVIPALKERSRPEATDRIKRTLALGQVAKLEDLKVDEDALKTRYQDTLVELRGQDIDPKRLMEVLSEDMLKEVILDWIEANWTLEMVPEGTLSQEDKVDTDEDTNVDIDVTAETIAE
jgi:trigger factor